VFRLKNLYIYPYFYSLGKVHFALRSQAKMPKTMRDYQPGPLGKIAKSLSFIYFLLLLLFFLCFSLPVRFLIYRPLLPNKFFISKDPPPNAQNSINVNNLSASLARLLNPCSRSLTPSLSSQNLIFNPRPSSFLHFP